MWSAFVAPDALLAGPPLATAPVTIAPSDEGLPFAPFVAFVELPATAAAMVTVWFAVIDVEPVRTLPAAPPPPYRVPVVPHEPAAPPSTTR